MSWSRPVARRYDRVLEATGEVPGSSAVDMRRYRAARRLDDLAVLLLDDAWASGGHAQSAALALRAAGARIVALVLIGRHLRRDREVGIGGPTCGELFDELPKRFDWATCTVH